MEVLDYLLSIKSSKSALNYALYGAGIAGVETVMQYLIVKGADDYNSLI